jgi:RNA polymerase sigma factor for flagellar operon FliA
MGVAIEDLIGAGNVGLAEAARRFDPKKGNLFATFARHRIRGAITDSLRQHDPISRSLRMNQKQADPAISALSVKLGRTPSDAEIA